MKQRKVWKQQVYQKRETITVVCGNAIPADDRQAPGERHPNGKHQHTNNISNGKSPQDVKSYSLKSHEYHPQLLPLENTRCVQRGQAKVPYSWQQKHISNDLSQHAEQWHELPEHTEYASVL